MEKLKIEKEEKEKQRKEDERIKAIRWWAVATCCGDLDGGFGEKTEKECQRKCDSASKNGVHKCKCGNLKKRY